MTGARAPRFGALLKHYRRQAGLTQEALAEQAGLMAPQGPDGLADRRRRNGGRPRYTPDDFRALLARRQHQPTAGAPMLVMTARHAGEDFPSIATVGRNLHELGLASACIWPRWVTRSADLPSPSSAGARMAAWTRGGWPAPGSIWDRPRW